MYLQVKKCRQDIVNKNNCHSNNNMEKHPDKKEIDNNNNNNNRTNNNIIIIELIIQTPRSRNTENVACENHSEPCSCWCA